MHRLRAHIALVMAVVVAAGSLALAGCRAQSPESAADTALAQAHALLTAKRYDDAVEAYLTVAHRSVTGTAFDTALAGAAEAFTSRVATLPVPQRVAAVAHFYDETPAWLRPPALTNATAAWLRASAADQIDWARLLLADRVRWLKEYAEKGSAQNRTVFRDGVSGDDARLLSPAECRAIADLASRLNQPADMAALYRLLADISEAEATYRRIGWELRFGQPSTPAQRLAVGQANGVVTELLPKAEAVLARLP